MLQPSPVPVASREPLLWVCTREGVFVLIGDQFHLLAGTQGKVVRTAAWHPRDRWFLGTPDQVLELVGSEAHRLRKTDVTAMVVDGRGELWVGTAADGLRRHAGSEWKEYRGGRQIPDNRIRGIAEDAEGMLYVGTGRGLTCFDRPRWLTIAWEWAVNSVRRSAPTGRVWVTFDTGIAAFRGMHRVERLEAGELPGTVLAATDAADGWTYMALGTRGLWRWKRDYDPMRISLHGEKPDDPAPAPVTHLLADAGGGLWVALQGMGVMRIQGASRRILGFAEGLICTAIEDLGRLPTPQ